MIGRASSHFYLWVELALWSLAVIGLAVGACLVVRFFIFCKQSKKRGHR